MTGIRQNTEDLREIWGRYSLKYVRGWIVSLRVIIPLSAPLYGCISQDVSGSNCVFGDYLWLYSRFVAVCGIPEINSALERTEYGSH